MRPQFLEPTGWLYTKPLEDVLEITIGIESVEPCGLDQAKRGRHTPAARPTRDRRATRLDGQTCEPKDVAVVVRIAIARLRAGQDTLDGHHAVDLTPVPAAEEAF